MNRTYLTLIAITVIGYSAHMQAGGGMRLLKQMYDLYQVRQAVHAYSERGPKPTVYDPSKANVLTQKVIPVTKDTRPLGAQKSTMFEPSKGLGDIVGSGSGKQGPIGLQAMLELDMKERKKSGIVHRSDLIKANNDLTQAEMDFLKMLQNPHISQQQKQSELKQMINGGSEGGKKIPGLEQLVRDAKADGDKEWVTYFTNFLNGVRADLH